MYKISDKESIDAILMIRSGARFLSHRKISEIFSPLVNIVSSLVNISSSLVNISSSLVNIFSSLVNIFSPL